MDEDLLPNQAGSLQKKLRDARRQRNETLGRLTLLRQYVRHLWDEERKRTGRGELPYNSAIRNWIGIETDEGWPNNDGTLRKASE